MKKLLYILAAVVLIGCSEKDSLFDDSSQDKVEVGGLELTTRANANQVAELTDYVGREQFANSDTVVFTSVKRTLQPLSQFTYKDLEFLCSVTTTAGITSIGWSRIKGKGTTEAATTETAPDRIYWSDAVNTHTFIGFSKPQQGSGEKPFDWNRVNIGSTDIYYGSLGDPTMTGEGNDTIDYRGGNSLLSKDDILLTYSTEIKAEDAIARLRFHHGLAQVRVIVNISDFAAGGKADTSSVVSDMKLKEMLTMYKWSQTDTTTTELASVDNTSLSEIYNASAPLYNQRKDVYLWIPQPEGHGEGSNRTFTFYGLAVPTEITSGKPLEFSFKVTYPNPMNPSVMQTKVYTSSISGIKMSSGKCTTINISLNHKNEKMTVGAEYDDWDFVSSPDQSALKKNSTFLDTMVRDSITILGDAKATADDATWLYVKEGAVVDVYGNDGSEDNPFVISTARQMLSFAYEVSGTSRKSLTPNGGHSAGWDFEGKYIVLDADIHLQSVVSVDSLTQNKDYRTNLMNWMGIGNSTTAFNGHFVGGDRHITHIKGGALFANIGSNAIISELNLSNVVQVNSHGALAENNAGLIYACRVEGDVESDNSVVGSLCGTNSGYIFECIHNGTVRGTASGARVGGLLGTNSGTVALSYHTGAIIGTNTYGVEDAATAGSKIFACYYNSTLAHPTNTVDGDNVQGRTLGQMQSRSFAKADLNDKISEIISDPQHKGLFDGLSETQKATYLSIMSSYQFVFTPGSYPRVNQIPAP